MKTTRLPLRNTSIMKSTRLPLRNTECLTLVADSSFLMYAPTLHQ